MENQIEYDKNILKKYKTFIRKTIKEITGLIADYTMNMVKYDCTEKPYHISTNIGFCGFDIYFYKNENGRLETIDYVCLTGMNFVFDKKQSDYGISHDKNIIMQDAKKAVDGLTRAKELVLKYISINRTKIKAA